MFLDLGQGDSSKDFLTLPIVKYRVYGWTDVLFLEVREESKQLHVYLALTAVLT